MNHLRFSTSAFVMLVYTGVCSALFYTNSKENDYPRIGKRPSVYLTRPIRRPQYAAPSSSETAATDLSELYETYPYLDPLVSLGMLSDTDVADRLESAETLDAPDAEQLPPRKNVYIMYDDSRGKKEVARRMPWPGTQSQSPPRRQRLWARYQPQVQPII